MSIESIRRMLAELEDDPYASEAFVQALRELLAYKELHERFGAPMAPGARE